MVLIVIFSSRISPRTSTVIFFERSPFATAVVTAAMFFTWPVRFDAIEFTESVRSFHVTATPFTLARPPSFPSVPTLRGTRGTFAAEVVGLSNLKDFAARIDGDLLREVTAGDGGCHLRHVAKLRREVRRHEVHVVGQILPRTGDTGHVGLATELSFGTHFAGHARHFGGERAELI